MVLAVRASDHWGVRSFGEQAGQATIEWLAVAVGVVALSGAFVTATPTSRRRAPARLRTLICRVGGGSCAVAPPTAPPAPARPPSPAQIAG